MQVEEEDDEKNPSGEDEAKSCCLQETGRGPDGVCEIRTLGESFAVHSWCPLCVQARAACWLHKKREATHLELQATDSHLVKCNVRSDREHMNLVDRWITECEHE